MTDFEIPFGEGGAVELRIVRPKGGKGRLPVVFYIHGGGWVMGDKNTHDRLVREIAVRTGAAVVFVNYTPSPSAVSGSAAADHDRAPLHRRTCGRTEARRGRIAVAGDSVGGNMAAALTLMCKAENGPAPPFPAAALPGDRRIARHGLLPGVRRRPVAYEKSDGVFLGCIRAGS